MCIYMNACYMCAGVNGDQKEVLDLLEMGERQLWSVGTGTELGSLARRVLSVFNSWTISPSLKQNIFKNDKTFK